MVKVLRLRRKLKKFPILLMVVPLFLLESCVFFIISGGSGLSQLEEDGSLSQLFDKDFPSLWHSSLYILRKEGFQIKEEDHSKGEIYATSQEAEIFLKFSNLTEDTTVLKIKTYKNKEVRQDISSRILGLIFRDTYNPRDFLED